MKLFPAGRMAPTRAERDLYEYRRTSSWSKYQSEDVLESLSRAFGEAGNSLFRELSRSLLFGHSVVIGTALTAARGLIENDGARLPWVVPLVTLSSVLGLIANGTAIYLMARHAQGVGAAYQALKLFKFRADLPYRKRSGFARAHLKQRKRWYGLRHWYQRLLVGSLVCFSVSLLITTTYLASLWWPGYPSQQ